MSLSLLFTKKEKFARHLKKICKRFEINTFDKHLSSAIQKKITHSLTDSVNNIGLRDASASKKTQVN